MNWLKVINVRDVGPVRFLKLLAKELEDLAGRQRVHLYEKDMKAGIPSLITPYARTRLDKLDEIIESNRCTNIRCVNTSSMTKSKVVIMNSSSNQEEIVVKVFAFNNTSELPIHNPVVNLTCSKCCPTVYGNKYPDLPLDFVCQHGKQACGFLDVSNEVVAASCSSTAAWYNEFENEQIPSVLNLTSLNRNSNHAYNLAPFYMKNRGRPRKNKRKRGRQDYKKLPSSKRQRSSSSSSSSSSAARRNKTQKGTGTKRQQAARAANAAKAAKAAKAARRTVKVPRSRRGKPRRGTGKTDI